MLGKKRNLENIRQKTISKSNLDTSHLPSSNPKKKSILSPPKITKELNNLYNMQRSICLSCIKAKNKKYSTNTFIPCIPFDILS